MIALLLAVGAILNLYVAYAQGGIIFLLMGVVCVVLFVVELLTPRYVR